MRQIRIAALLVGMMALLAAAPSAFAGDKGTNARGKVSWVKRTGRALGVAGMLTVGALAAGCGGTPESHLIGSAKNLSLHRIQTHGLDKRTDYELQIQTASGSQRVHLGSKGQALNWYVGWEAPFGVKVHPDSGEITFYRSNLIHGNLAVVRVSLPRQADGTYRSDHLTAIPIFGGNASGSATPRFLENLSTFDTSAPVER